MTPMPPRARLLATAMRETLPPDAGGMIDADFAALVADDALRAVPAGPFVPVLRLTRDLDVHDYEHAAALGDAIRDAFPQAGPLLVLGAGADLLMLDDGELARIGLARLPG